MLHLSFLVESLCDLLVQAPNESEDGGGLRVPIEIVIIFNLSGDAVDSLGARGQQEVVVPERSHSGVC